ncbi:DUF1292 domain-containing protein [Alkaliphilus crotonatoxidans]
MAHDHEHHDHCGCHQQESQCGCGHDHHHHNKIYLTIEDNQQVECDVLDIFTVMEQEYIALLPTDGEDAFIYRFHEDEEGPHLTMIEEEEEFNRVSEAFLANFEGEQEE